MPVLHTASFKVFQGLHEPAPVPAEPRHLLEPPSAAPGRRGGGGCARWPRRQTVWCGRPRRIIMMNQRSAAPAGLTLPMNVGLLDVRTTYQAAGEAGRVPYFAPGSPAPHWIRSFPIW